MELHSVIKKNKAVIFAGICMKPEKMHSLNTKILASNFYTFAFI